MKYQTGGNAGETAFDVINGTQINIYSFSLPTPFTASTGVKYWVYIVASQQGSVPDWCFIAGTGGSGNHYVRTSGAGGDIMYRFMPGDVAFALLGPATEPLTPTSTIEVTLTPSNIAASPATNTPGPTPTPVPQQVPTCLGSVITFHDTHVFLFNVSNLQTVESSFTTTPLTTNFCHVVTSILNSSQTIVTIFTFYSQLHYVLWT